MTDKILCPQCEKGHLNAATWSDDFRHYDGTVHVTGLQSYLCDVCGADPVFRDQIIYNEKRIADAKRNATGRMTGRDVRRVREKLGLTQQEAAVLFGGGANAFSKYERGEVMQSVAMDRLLRMTALWPFMLPALRQMAETGDSLEVAPASYERNTPVCVNDPNYRSRTVQGESVVVNLSTWKSEAKAA